MSIKEIWARDHVEKLERIYREEHDNADILHDEMKDRALSDSAFDDAEDLWGVR